jgi:hypothetical protein
MKAEVLANPPKYFRAPISRGGEPRVDREGGYRQAGIIRGVSVITAGEALGHSLWIDQVTLSQVESQINQTHHGIKSRFTHPSMSGDGLGKHVARVRDAELSGNQVLADQHMLASSHKTPDGDLGEYLMSLAEEDPTSYGLSIAFQHDSEAMDQFQVQHSADGQFRSPDPLNVNHYPHVRIAAGGLVAADSVDEPAANSAGLFHRAGDPAIDADALAAYALGLNNNPPETTQFGLDPDRVRGFMTRFLSSRNLEVRMAEETAITPDPETTEAATEVLAMEVGSRVKVRDGMAHDESHAGIVGTVGEVSTPAFGIRWDSSPDVVSKWYTEAELELTTGDAPAETPESDAPAETEASATEEAKRFAKDVEGLRSEVATLKQKLSALSVAGEDTPVSFDAGDQKTKSGLASLIRCK